MDKEPINWSALDISKAYAKLEKKSKQKKIDGGAPKCVCGELLELIEGSLHCWRCYPSDE